MPTTQESLSWRAAGGSPARNGLFERAASIQAPPRRRLIAQGAIQASAVFDQEGRILVADMAGGIQAFSPQGDLLWKAKVSGGISATPVIHPEKARVYVGTHAGLVLALDTGRGTVLWKREVSTASDPRILSDLLYVPQSGVVVLSSWGGRFHALEAESGSEQFSWEAGISPGSAAAADGEGAIYCLRALSQKGVELVRVSIKGEESVLDRVAEDRRGARRALVAAGPVWDAARGVLLFVVNQDRRGQLRAWSLKSNSLLWEHSLSNSVQAALTLYQDGAVAVADLAGSVHAIEPGGTALFHYASKSEYLLAGGVSEAGGTFYVGDPCGVVHAVNRQGSGQVLFEASRSIQARPSFDAAGNLYVPSSDRTVYVFPVKT